MKHRFPAFIATTALCLAASAETYGPDNLPPEVHPPIMTPIPDGLSLDVPAELGNQRLAKLGLVDATAAPFNADPTGKRDATAALQRAIDFARDAQMVCFLPPGTYTVSDTLVMRHGIHMRSHRATFMNNSNMPCVLVGSRRGSRTPAQNRVRIVLRARSTGFGDPKHPKYVIEHRQFDVRKFTVAKNRRGGGASLMNTVVADLDIVIGPENSGAVGMHIRSCEGSAVQNVTVDARNGLAGIAGGTGNGGSWTNVTVIGGRIGLDVRGWTPPTPTMEGITLLNQTEAAIMVSCRGTLTAVGVRIVSDVSGPAIMVRGNKWAPFDSGLNLVDSEIVFQKPGATPGRRTAISTDRSVVLSNVYVHGADEVVAGSLPGDASGWLHVKMFAAGGAPVVRRGIQLSCPVYVDRRKMSGPLIETAVGAAPPPDLQARHIWGSDFPSWESPKAVNVKHAPYNARGDSFHDDTDALQRAINEHDVVFLPKGYYRVTRTLELRPHTRLVGVAQHLSVIMARDPEQGFGPDGEPGPLVETANDPEADTVLAFIGVRFPFEVSDSYSDARLPVYALKWRCGRRSILRSVILEPLRVYGFVGGRKHKQPPLDCPAVVVSDHGGGRWYNYHSMSFFMNTTRKARNILVEDTSEPLFFYNFEPQGGTGEAVAEIRRARRVTIYGCKTECDTTFLKVTDSKNIAVFGHGGIGNAAKGGALYLFERCTDFLVANIADQVNLKENRPYYGGHAIHRSIREFFPLLDRPRQGPPVVVPWNERPALYRVGRPLSP
ncbi:MAG: hypothetical protein GXP31_10510 [Kiritimatiellaeota bacterium]|nr:hypothetical protein [Kiritimatiellota bacterium]